MILSKNTNPINNVYYNGAKIIECLNKHKATKFDFFELYEKVIADNKITLQSYIFSIDWLYIAGLINSDDQGNILKCF